MRKILILAALILLVGVVAWAIFYQLKNGDTPRKNIATKDLLPLVCDLNLNPCEFEFRGKKVRIDFKEKPVQSMVENELTIENLGDFKDLNARIYGLNMFMGEISPKFTRIDAQNPTLKDGKALNFALENDNALNAENSNLNQKNNSTSNTENPNSSSKNNDILNSALEKNSNLKNTNASNAENSNLSQKNDSTLNAKNPNSSLKNTNTLNAENLGSVSVLYKANIVFSACVLDLMRFRVEFYDGKKPLNFHFDIDIKR